MLAWARDRFNQEFTEEQYRAFVDAVTTGAGVPIEFRLSETPCFFPSSLLDSLVEAAQVMTRQLLNNAAYRTAADAMVPERFRLANGETLPTCVQVDFGLVRTDSGAIEGRLVELQAFPSLYGFQMLLAETALGHLGESGHLGLEGDGSRSVAGEMTSEVRPQRSLETCPRFAHFCGKHTRPPTFRELRLSDHQRGARRRRGLRRRR